MFILRRTQMQISKATNKTENKYATKHTYIDSYNSTKQLFSRVILRLVCLDKCTNKLANGNGICIPKLNDKKKEKSYLLSFN